MTIFSLPVKALAPRTAIMTASVPEFAKRTFSTDATRPTIRSASSACSPPGAGNTVPSAACSPHGLVYGRHGVAVDRGGVVVQEVDELVAVRVPDAAAGAGGDHQRIRRKKGERAGIAAGIERSSRSRISRDLSVLIPYPASMIPTLPSCSGCHPPSHGHYISTCDRRPPAGLSRIVFYGILGAPGGRSGYGNPVHSPLVVGGMVALAVVSTAFYAPPLRRGSGALARGEST